VTVSDLIHLEEQYGAHNYTRLDVVVERAEGVWVYDVRGRRYLDCLAAYSAVNQGHCHPRIRQALVDQASRVTLTSRAFRNDQAAAALPEAARADRLRHCAADELRRRGVETALKMARKWGTRIKGIPPTAHRSSRARTTSTGARFSIVSFSTRPYRDGSAVHAGLTVIPTASPASSMAASRPTPARSSSSRCRGKPESSMPPEG